MSLIHLARQGFITKSALPNVTRQRGTTTGTANLMLYGAGKDHSIGTNTTFTDSSSNNFTVTRNGDTIQATNNPFTGSVYFDGNGDYLTTPNNAAFTFGTGDFTIEFWARYGSYGANGGNFISNTSDSLNIYYSNTGKLGYWNATVATDSSQTIPLNTWFHCAAVRSGTTLKLYYNGTQVLSVTESRNLTANNIVIGRNGSAGTYYLDGFMTNIRVVKGTAVYTANFTVPTSPLTAITNTQLLLLTAQQAPFRDSSSNNFTVTANGNAAGSGLEPFPVNYAGSGYFDGTGDYLSVADNAAFTLGTGDFTIECWVNLTSASTTRWVTGQTSSGFAISSSSFLIAQTTANKINGVICSGSTTYEVLSASAISLNTWVHIAFVRNGTSLLLFIDGVQSNSLTISAALSVNDSTNQVGIGRAGEFNSEYLQGYVSNLRFIKGTAQYTANFTPPAAPLTAVTNTQLLLLTNNVGPFVDTSANGFPVLRNGDAVQTGFSPFTGQPSAGSGYYDGNGDYLSIPYNSAFNLSSGDWTVELWWYPTSTSVQDQTLISVNYSGGDGYAQARIAASTINRFYMLSSATGSTWLDITQRGSWSLNQWHHLAYVRSGSTFTLYVNGVSAGSYTSSSTLTNNSGVTEVGRTISTTSFWQYTYGYISNARVIKGTALYTSNFTPATAPLPAVPNTSLLLNTDNYTIANSTPTYLPVTVNGNTTVSTAQYPTGMNRSIYFDGNGDYLQVPDNTAFAFGTGDFTVELFINFSILNSNVGYVSSYNGPTTGWYIRNDSANTFLFGFGDTALVSTTWTKSTNTWYHISATRSGTTLKLFIDGVESASVTNSTNITSSGATLKIGALAPQLGYANWFFTGYISNVRIVKGAALYTANFTPPAAPLPLSVTVPAFVTNNIYGVYQLA